MVLAGVVVVVAAVAVIGGPLAIALASRVASPQS
jgi:hypothetical protein